MSFSEKMVEILCALVSFPIFVGMVLISIPFAVATGRDDMSWTF